MTAPGACPRPGPAVGRFGFASLAGDFSGLPPVLGGAGADAMFPPATARGAVGAVRVYRAGGWLLGVGTRLVADDLEAVARALYDDLLRAARGHALARIWNYVPAINAPGRDGLENYRAFCRGRAHAFEAEFGADYRRQASAASAVGGEGAMLTVGFAATAASVRHLENPLQIPAYHYPPDYGPRAPTFARATVVDAAPTAVFVSGTAAIRGHRTIAPDDTAAQLDYTLENLRAIARACGLGPDLAGAPGSRRHFTAYLRHAADLGVVRARLDAALFRPADTITYLRSDICRRELNIEIEATLLPPPAA
ncbi:MAG: hypothetical protein RLZZ15_3515 [Verrucomicrobiota bacterium]|jgi:hypothetical protein